MQSVGVEVRVTGSCSAIKYCTKSVYPQSRAHHGACHHDNYIYVLSGKDGNLTLKDFWRFHLGNHVWEKLNYRGDLPHHLQGHTLLSFKKLLLLFGGEFGDALTESSLWIINPDLGFVRKASLDVGSDRPCVRRYHSAVIFRDSMYVYGGYVDVKGSSSEFWKYNVEDEEWECLVPVKRSHDRPGRRYGHSAVVYKQSMWVYGGMNNLLPKQDLWTYSFISERWERIKCKMGPPPLTGHSAAVVGSQMVIYGGETNREPVNQVWTFNFLTHKWTQVLFPGADPPSKTLHLCVLVNPVSVQEGTVKARSTPYLQYKAKDQIKRPKSSPGYRLNSNSEPIRKDNQNSLIFERTNSAIEAERPNNFPSSFDSCSVCRTRIERSNVCPYQRSKSNDEISIRPSPSENTQDVFPLVPPSTDINYNNVYMLDKDAVNNGLDNPGISDSTEKLIEESRMHGECSRECVMPDVLNIDHQYMDKNLNCPEKRKICTGCLNSANVRSVFKKHRLDAELILEDLEFQDCFPYNIQVPFPANNQISLERACTHIEDIETIELQDFGLSKNQISVQRAINHQEAKEAKELYILEHGNNQVSIQRALNHQEEKQTIELQDFGLSNKQISVQRACNDSKDIENVELQNFGFSSPPERGGNVSLLASTFTPSRLPLDSDGHVSVDTYSTTPSRLVPPQSINYAIFTVNGGEHLGTDQPVTPTPDSVDCDIYSQEQETSFQTTDIKYSNNQYGYSGKKAALNKTDVPEKPYLLVIGGRDKQAVNFTAKPLSLMKLQLRLS